MRAITIILIVLFTEIISAQQFGHLKFDSINDQVVITYDSNDPYRVYWDDNVKYYGVRVKDFETWNFEFPWELWGHETEIQNQTDDCINQWKQGGCLNIVKSNDFPACPIEFNDDMDIFPTDDIKGFTAFAVYQAWWAEEYHLVEYSGSSVTYYEQTAVLLNASPFKNFLWSTTLQQPTPPSTEVPVKPIILHEMGHLIGLGHHLPIVEYPTVMAYPAWTNPYVFNLTDVDVEHRDEICTVNGTPTGIEDGILITGYPSVIYPNQYNNGFSAMFVDQDPYGDYLVDGPNWIMKAKHGGGDYTVPGGPRYFTNLPKYCWLRDQNGNVVTEVIAYGTDNDGIFHQSSVTVGTANIPFNTTSGSLSSDETWCGSITITGNVTVPSGITLEILPGATLEFQNNSSLIINGTFISEGLSYSEIEYDFISPNSNGIIFNSGSSGNVNYVNVDNAFQGISLNGTNAVTISNSKISNCSGNGVQVVNVPDFEISNCSFVNNYISIYVSGSGGSITNNNLTSNSIGHSIQIQNSSTVDCIGNSITKTSPNQYRGAGIEYVGGTSGIISENNISYCDRGISIIWSSSATSFLSTYPSKNNRIRNCNYGIVIYRDSYGTFGIPSAGDQYGRNSIYGNTYSNASIGTTYPDYASGLYACYNWWGDNPPNTSKFSVGANAYFYYSPYLSSDPWAGLSKTSNFALTSTANASNHEVTGILSTNQETLLQGIELRINKRYGEAKDFFISYLDKYPDNQQAYVELYNCYSKETADDIIRYFNSLPKAASNNHKLLLSYLYQKQGNIEAARNVNNSIAKENSNTSLAARANINNLYIALYNENNLEGAVNIFHEVLNKQALSTSYELADVEYAIKNFARTYKRPVPEFLELKGSQQPDEVSSENSEAFNLTGNFPNPFNPTTIINYSVPTNSNVKISIYDITGALIKSFVFNSESAGYHKIEWDGTNERGTKVSSGMYIYRMEAVSLDGNAERFVQSRKMILLK